MIRERLCFLYLFFFLVDAICIRPLRNGGRA
jgi:hypothetical protein